MSDEDDDLGEYCVVKNDEEQYSIWRVGHTVPAGWVVAGPSGPKQVCLDYIDGVWTDMRPLSLRRAMSETTGTGGP